MTYKGSMNAALFIDFRLFILYCF